MLTSLLGAVVLASLPVRVESATCPSGQEVEQALTAILSSVSEAIQPDVARVLRWGNRLHVELVSPDAALIAERWIEDSGECVELAELIAVVIASWESDVRPSFSRPHPETIAVPEKATARPLPPPVPKPAAFYEVAAGASLSWSGSPALGGVLALRWVPHGVGPGLRLSATVESTRTQDLADGRAQWRRWTGSAEIDWRVPSGPRALDLHGGLALAWLAARGVGFLQNHSDDSFSAGGTAGARFSRQATRHISVWLELAVTYWPRKQLLSGQPNATQHEIPHYQGLASIGLAVGPSSSGP
jgi:hypothetical protein